MKRNDRFQWSVAALLVLAAATYLYVGYKIVHISLMIKGGY